MSRYSSVHYKSPLIHKSVYIILYKEMPIESVWLMLDTSGVPFDQLKPVSTLAALRWTTL